jgi:tRNA(Ile)-lysidine synthetase-like protein
MQASESEILHKVRTALSDEAQGRRLLLAVSGGLDSVAMLDIVVRLSPELGCEPVVGHVDHGLRPESKADAEFVCNLAGRLGLPSLSRKGDTLALARQEKLSREAAARKLRYQALREMAEEAGCDHILTAHTADDSAETFLMRFIQSTDWWEWTSIPQKWGPVLRPLISVQREQVRRYALGRGLAWRDDATNEDPRFLRNYMRLKVMPRLAEQGGGLDIPALARAGGKIRDIVEGMLKQADAYVREVTTGHQRAKKLLAIPDIFCYFNLMPWAPVERAVAQLRQNPDFRWPAWCRRQVAAFIAGQAPKGRLSIGSDIHLVRNGPKLAVARSLPAQVRRDVRGLGWSTLDGVGELGLSIRPNNGMLEKGNRIQARADLAGHRLQLRTWRPGDTLDIFGRGRRKVSRLLSELRVDPASRMGALVLCDEEGPFWLVGHWCDQRIRPSSTDTTVLELEWKTTEPPR